jgi:AbrB family looped-hinge helix DNA binding protein
MAPDRLKTVVSTKGQVILPKAVRQRRRWGAGTQLVVEETAEGVLLKQDSLFAPTRPEDVFASLPRPDRPRTIDEMNAAITAEARRRARD